MGFKKNVSLKNKEINQIINHKEDGKTIYIFVKKNDSEGSQHYYLGEAEYMKVAQMRQLMSQKIRL